LATRAQKQPRGEFRYYGRNIGDCDLCVNLPVIMHISRSGGYECAALIDVDEEHATTFSVFDFRDLWRALSELLRVCWLGEMHNGKGYPGSQTAWTTFVKGRGWVKGGYGTEGNRTVGVVDLGYGWLADAAGVVEDG
ncbi:MAG: hypothetical protein Q9213_007511, partial [Squamulea squamosa]